MEPLDADWTGLRSVAEISDDATAFVRLLLSHLLVPVHGETAKEERHGLGHACPYADLGWSSEEHAWEHESFAC